MNQHTYVRAYMAGIAFPTAFLLVALAIFCFVRFVFHASEPIERMIVFPMAVIPNLFGAWNMLFVKVHERWQVPIGLHGAVLPFFLGPIGAGFASAMGFIQFRDHGLNYFGVLQVPFGYLIFFPFIGIAAYYLIWKYVVGFFNKVLGVSC